ncbi:MAG: U32 family peptidase [Gemmataceae bacterium]|nr:U32 family peptidase [Gemmataceae bacterium]
MAPQGEYAEVSQAPDALPDCGASPNLRPVELLAPAGGLDSAFAAFHYGADAVYLGLKKFSARAEAENFTLEEVDEITAYAHALAPRRRVFVAVNTVLRQDELPELIDALAALEDSGVDAVILQDLGVYRALRTFFPKLEVHGSTQMAVHNRAGAETLRRLGFARVVLARELTFEEVEDITSAAGVETEVFVHGALCYSYSGLCLFSAQTLGRSGNRGKCAYSCRDSYEVTGAPTKLRDGAATKRDPRTGFPFSMKDLALPDHLPALRAAGVSCFKIEGRKKSPLYVATTTDYYRRLLDGKLAQSERPSIEADLQSVFSRPWTRLFVQSAQDKEVADRDTVGHRGTRIGDVEAVLSAHSSHARLRFTTRRALQKHDGLQIDLPTLGKPFGFAVDRLTVAGKSKARELFETEFRGSAFANRVWERGEVFEAPADSVVEVALPADHPHLPIGAAIYCSSSQEVKQRYQFDQPKPGQHRGRKPLAVEATLTHEALTLTLRSQGIETSYSLAGPFPKAKDAGVMEAACRSAFARLGDTPFHLDELTWRNDDDLFVPVSRLNQSRRAALTSLAGEIQRYQAARVAQIKEVVRGPSSRSSKTAAVPFKWSLKVDRVAFVNAFETEDWSAVDELIVDIARDHPTILQDNLDGIAAKIGKERIRLALPALTRAWEDKGLRHKIAMLRDAGWRKWEAANLSAWSYLNVAGTLRVPSEGTLAGTRSVPSEGVFDGTRSVPTTLDLAADWSLYVLNRLAACQLLDMGVTRFAFSPEDGLANFRSLLAEFGEQAVVIAHQDTPLFIAESCAYANLIGGCPGKANCKFESMEMISSHGEKVTALDYHCRTIVLNQGPYCLSMRLKDLAQAGARNLRLDFVYRPYDADEVKKRWRIVRAGKHVPGGHCANFDRGIL